MDRVATTRARAGTCGLGATPGWQDPAHRGTLATIAVGALGGLTDPLAAFPGAFVTMWCGMQGWDKVTQRSTYQPYILIVQVLTLAALIAVSRCARLDAELLTYALPGIAGAVVGLHIFRRLTDLQFPKARQPCLDRLRVALALK